MASIDNSVSIVFENVVTSTHIGHHWPTNINLVSSFIASKASITGTSHDVSPIGVNFEDRRCGLTRRLIIVASSIIEGIITLIGESEMSDIHNASPYFSSITVIV